MENLNFIFKSMAEHDVASIVVCDLDHTIIYMNPEAKNRHGDLLGHNLLKCHNDDSNKKILKVIEWFNQNPNNNRIFTYYNPKRNRDVYMVALRNDENQLIGYYEKHECRTLEKDAACKSVSIKDI